MTHVSPRIQAAVAVDNCFGSYLIEMVPAEALEFAKAVGTVDHCTREQFVTLILRINKVMPLSILERKGPAHGYRVGRDADRRILYVRFSTAHFHRTYRFKAMLNVLEKYAKDADALYQVQSDEGWFDILFWWI